MNKLLLILAMVFLIQNMAYADEGRGKGKRFEENKGRVLENIGKKIGFLNFGYLQKFWFIKFKYNNNYHTFCIYIWYFFNNLFLYFFFRVKIFLSKF